MSVKKLECLVFVSLNFFAVVAKIKRMEVIVYCSSRYELVCLRGKYQVRINIAALT